MGEIFTKGNKLAMDKIIITSKQAGIRIDKFLSMEFFLYSRGEIIKKIKNGEVQVNGKKIKPSYFIEENDVIALENFSKEKNNALVFNKKIPLKIIFKDKNIIVINKQAGVQVHPSHNEKTNTIVNAFINKFPEISNVHDDSIDGKFRPGIVHRLDKDTSGVLVIARNTKAFKELQKHFKDRSIEKKYVAICQGIFAEKEGIIKKPIARSASYRKQVIARKNTKTTIREAVTKYKVAKEYGVYSLVDVFPKTGRMHQIRVHLASIGHPVVGDLVYGDGYSAPRQLLHAKELWFELFGEKYHFSAPIPKDFKDFLAKI
jgi:23S rRNA pseudouridine1911/1915/1917 synthase